MKSISLIATHALRTTCAALVGLALTAAIRNASAGVPDASHCTVDHVIISSYDNTGAVAGNGPCTPGATRGFDVFVRDVANNPVAGATVSLQFQGTGTGIKPYQLQNPGVSVDCSTRTISALTDASGHAQMVARFGHFAETSVIPVYADGVFLKFVEARSPDYFTDGTVTLNDYSQFVTDYTAATLPPRSDFADCPSNKLGAFLFFAEQFLAAQGQPIQQHCP